MQNIFSKEKIDMLSSELNVSPLFAEILLSRGIDNAEAANLFLNPSIERISDPFSLPGMKEAVVRVRQAIDEKEKIVVYGDYDCDGVTATAILVDYLRSLGADVDYFIPNRFENGYGLNTESLEEIAETLFPDLLITVDCGISSVSEAEYLADVLAIDLIVTDHHTLPDVLPEAIVLNPKLAERHPARDLCGAGVAFKLVQALGGISDAMNYVALAGIATIADVVPLTNENRIIASLGLKKLNAPAELKKGLRMLLESCDFDKPISAFDVAFRVAPRINAVGRIADAKEVVKLFLSDEFLELQGLVDKINTANELRKSLTTATYNEAKEMLKEVDLASHKLIFLYKEDWNVGILGLVAARLCREFSRPTVILSGEDEIKGSARATEGIDLYQTVKSAESALLRFGGHKGAAGLSVLRENLIEARNLMEEYLDKTYPSSAFMGKEENAFALNPDQITVSFAEELLLLEPTGESNPKPLFCLDSRSCLLSQIGNTPHVKSSLNREAELVAFGFPYLAEGSDSGVQYHFIAECYKDVYKNRERVQMKVSSVYPVGFSKASENYLFNRYLRSNLYPESPCSFTPIKFAEAKNAFYDDDFCTLFLAFSSDTALAFREDLDEKKIPIEYGRPANPPSNTILLAPDFDFSSYKRIVLLDTPLSKGYVSYLNKKTNAEIYVVTDRYSFKERFASFDLSRDAVYKTFIDLRGFVFSGNAANSPMELASKLAPSSCEEFLTKFYVLFENGSVRVGQGFSLYPQSFFEPTDSTLYRRIFALLKQK